MGWLLTTYSMFLYRYAKTEEYKRYFEETYWYYFN